MPVRTLMAVLLIISVTSCLKAPGSIDLPRIGSGQVAVIRGAGHGSERILSPAELSALSRWLKLHREGWRDVLETPPSPQAVITLNFTDGRQRTLTVFANCPTCKGWDATLLISSGDDDTAIQQFPPKDFEFIQRLILPGG